jgi:hypothetical protein
VNCDILVKTRTLVLNLSEKLARYGSASGIEAAHSSWTSVAAETPAELFDILIKRSKSGAGETERRVLTLQPP